MKTTLKRLGDGDYKLYNTDGSCIATTKESPYKKLSVKHCDKIFGVVNVEKLVDEEFLECDREIMKTIAQQLNIKEFPFVVEDSNGNITYIEDEDGWTKREFDSNGNLIHVKRSDGYWRKQEWDADDNLVYTENNIDGIVYDIRIK